MLKPYESYKETNISWLGEVPKHWDIFKTGQLFVQRKTKVSDKVYPPLSVTKNGIVPQLANAAKSNDGDNRKLACENDFVINSRSDRKGSSGISSLEGSVSLINIVLEPRTENNQRYTHYLLRCNDFIEEYYRNGRGIVADLWTTRYEEMKTIYLPIPSLSEQEQIVKYLDWQTSKINTIIVAKKKQIELLKEQKQALINKAVTKGLDDTVPMKDSGVEWIGEVPEHWELRRLKTLGTAIIGLTYSPGNLVDKDNGTLVFRSSNIQNGVITYDDNVYVNSSIADILRTKENDILICSRNGSRSLVGKCALITENDIGNSFGAFTTVFRTDYSKIVYFILNSVVLKGVMGLFSTSTINQLTTSILNAIVTPFPPLEEQKAIVTYLEEQTALINKAITVIENEIELVSEYKTSLISSVVIGKLDVRDLIVPEFKVVEDIVEETNKEMESEEE